jgi:ferric-dicitrate binding protein FerR (iron transport regulator)
MKDQIAKEILDRYLIGESSAEEHAMVETWYNRLSENQKAVAFVDYARHYEQLLAALPTAEEITVTRLWPRIAIAVAVAAIIFGAGLFYFAGQTGKSGQEATYASDVDPGKQGATLMLANGQKVRIGNASAGNIAEQSGVKISKTADGQIIYELTDNNTGNLEYNTLSTTRGEQIQLRLPDGSLVFLNAASSLKYPTSFANAETRRVSLTGEGYFEISKDKAHPFIVATEKQEVEVYGTDFNINAYPDESVVATTLLEGSVLVRSKASQQMLKPGFQALNNGTAIKVIAADIENITDWKDGDFNLDGLDFKSAMRKIGRWYNVEVIYESGVPNGIKTGGWISRDNKLSDVLKLIEKSGSVHFKVFGGKLYVSK